MKSFGARVRFLAYYAEYNMITISLRMQRFNRINLNAIRIKIQLLPYFN